MQLRQLKVTKRPTGGGWAPLDRLGRAHCCATKTLLALRGAVLSVSDITTPLLLVRAEPVLPVSSVSDLLVCLLALLYQTVAQP